MKRYLIIQMCQAALGLSAIASPFAPDPATEVVVYSPSSSSPLHVSTISTNPLESVISSAFPSSYTGHRAVCPIKRATTNDDFCAWIGGSAYAPGDPFGVSTGRGHPAIRLSKTSPIVNRINPWTGTGDRPTTPTMKDKFFIDTLSSGDSTRLRIVRYSLDFIPCNRLGVTNRVVADVTLNKFRRPFICESDIFTNQFFDIDGDLVEDTYHLHLPIEALTNLTYMVVVGNGQTSLPYVGQGGGLSVTNVTALPILIERRHDPYRVKPIPLGSRSTSSGTELRFRIPCGDPTAWEFGNPYTACRVRVYDGASTVYDSGVKILPVADSTETYTLKIDERFSTGGLTWRICLHDSKFTWVDNLDFSDTMPLNN